MSNNIYIFSRPVRSGKTTELARWIQDQKAAGGILTPDIDGLRHLVDIATGNAIQLETKNIGQSTIEIGKFIFLEESFQQARTILLNSMHGRFEWFIVDEVGKLEIERKEGLEPALEKIIKHHKTINTKLLLVIRDSLLQKAITYYHLDEAIIVNNLCLLA